jgi:cellulose synthase/poly-beta-1,6-N-acetylglucosamine synthase-like glycosyltransferase
MTSLTIGICAYNEAWNMAELLTNILTIQKIPKDAEIITVCSGCNDGTPEIVREFANRDHRVKLIEEKRRLGKASAVNKILSQARGRRIVFISADVIPRQNCIMGLATATEEEHVGVACGRPEPIRRGGALMKGLVETLWGFHNWQLEKLNHAGVLMHASEVFCIRSGIVKEIPEGLVNDDAFLAVAAKRRGFQIKYVPQSEVKVFGPQTISDYLKQRRRIIAGHYQVHSATGRFSQYIFYSLLARPRLTMKTLTAYYAKFKRTSGVLVTGLIEVLANLMALCDVARGRSQAVWDISPTTKTVAEL